MGYSIFQNTMVDMTYPEIEEAIKGGACALLPISVVEEHGPHLCTGTDIYLTEIICEKIKAALNAKGIPSLIAPPFFWGVNSITDGFTGSFSISPSLMESLLLEILENLHKWGITKIFLLNFHGDFVHIKEIVEVAKRAFEELGIETYFINSQDTFMQLGLMQGAPYLLPVPLSQNTSPSKYIDIHAGSSETSWMMLDFPDLVYQEIARQQPPTNLSMEELRVWLHGGDAAKALTPSGYCGNPADIELEKIREIEGRTVTSFADCIEKMLR